MTVLLLINPGIIQMCILAYALLFPNRDAAVQHRIWSFVPIKLFFLMRKHFVGNVINVGHNEESAECVVFCR